MNTEHYVDWSNVAVEKINKPEAKDQQGVKIKFMLSPSDIPNAYRTYDKDGMLYIEFKYLTSPEAHKKISQQDGVDIYVGKNSRRVYRIVVDSKMFADSEGNVEVEIGFVISADKALKEMKRSGSLSSGNVDAIRRFLQPATTGKAHLFDQLSFGH